MKITTLENVLDNHLKAHLRGVSLSWTDNLIGSSGIGKTYMVKHLATSNDCLLISVPISELEPGDLVGSPHAVQIRPNVFVQMYALPNWLPHIRVDEYGDEMYKTFEDGITRPLIDIDLLGSKVENRKQLIDKWGNEWRDKVKGAVIFFDEINRAMDDTMKNAIFEFVEKGRMHTYESPWNTYRISAMNPPNNNYFVNEMTDEKAFMGRFNHIVMEITTEEWLSWAEKRGIHPIIRNFIAADPKALLEEEEVIQLNVKRMPRSYERISVLMTETDFPSEKSIRKELYHGIIGKEYGDNLIRHEEKEFNRIPTPEELLSSYPTMREELLKIGNTRNDYLNMVHQYMLAFLSNESKVFHFFESEEKSSTEREMAFHNLVSFIMDMKPHSKSIFIRKATNYKHINTLLGKDTALFESLMKELQTAYETE